MLICDNCESKEKVKRHTIEEDKYIFESGDFCDLCWSELMNALRFAHKHIQDILELKKKHDDIHSLNSDYSHDGPPDRCYTNTERTNDGLIDCRIV